MKKILTLLLLAFIAKAGWAQEGSAENELKNFRFGLKAAPAFTWYAPDDKKKFESGGVRMKFGYGLITEFRLSKIISLATGIEVNYDGGTLSFKDTALYFVKDDDLVEIENAAMTTGDSTVATFRLTERKYNASYVTLPVTFKMKTKEIGMLTYYGMFGVNASFRTKARSDDKFVTVNVPAGTTYDGTDVDITKDMNILKFALNVGGGAEYNLSGSTSLVFGLNFYKGFSNVLKGESRYMQESILVNKPVEQKATANAVVITVGILF